MSTHLLTIESSFTRLGIGTVLLPYLETKISVPRDRVFEVELRGAHGVVRVQARAQDSTVHEFVGGSQMKTFVELPDSPEFELVGVGVWLV